MEQSGCDLGPGVGGWRLSVSLGWPRTIKRVVGATEGVGSGGRALEEPQGAWRSHRGLEEPQGPWRSHRGSE